MYAHSDDEVETKQQYSTLASHYKPSFMKPSLRSFSEECDMDDSGHAAYYTPAGSPVTHERKRMTSMEGNDLSSQSSIFDTEPKQLTPILKKIDLQSSSSVRFRQDSGDSDADIEDSQRWTPPTVRRRGSRVDTPHPEVRHRMDTSSERGH